MTTRVVTAHLPEELAEKLDGRAEELGRPQVWVVKEAVKAYFDLAEGRRQGDDGGARGGRCRWVAEHQEVEAWVRECE